MTGGSNPFLPQTYLVPVDENQKDIRLSQYLNDLALSINSKDSGVYDTLETITGQKYLPVFSTATASNATYRDVFRVIVNFGSLPNTGTKSVAHGLTIGSTWTVTRLYGAATNPSNSFIPLPYASPTLANNIELNVDGTNVNVITGSDRTAYTASYVVLEYMKV